MQSIYLDTAIAVVFVFLLFSVIAYVIQERIASLRKSRGKMLEYAIGEIFKDPVNLDFNILLYEHPQIDLLRKTKYQLPSYIPASNFATALIDVIGRQSEDIVYLQDAVTGLLKESNNAVTASALEKFKKGVESLKYSELKILLNSFLLNAAEYKDLEATIIKWFDDYMQRVTGWYKKGTRNNLLVISVCLVLFFNIDAIYLVQNVYYNSQLRTTLVTAAEKTTDHPTLINRVMSYNLESKLAFTDSLYKSKINNTADSLTKQKLIQEWASVSKSIADSLGDNRQMEYDSLLKEVSSYGLPIGWEWPKESSKDSCTCDTATRSSKVKDTASKKDSLKSDTIIKLIISKYKITKGIISDTLIKDSINLDTASHHKEAKSMLKQKNAGFLKMVINFFERIQNSDTPMNAPRRTIWTVLLGWVIAAMGISFGAPFWFDLLGKLVNIRRTGLKPSDSSLSSTSKAK